MSEEVSVETSGEEEVESTAITYQPLSLRQINRILRLRKGGASIPTISEKMNLPVSSIGTFLKGISVQDAKGLLGDVKEKKRRRRRRDDDGDLFDVEELADNINTSIQSAMKFNAFWNALPERVKDMVARKPPNPNATPMLPVSSGSNTQDLLAQMREYSMSIGLLQALGGKKDDPMLQYMRTELDRLKNIYTNSMEEQMKFWRNKATSKKEEPSVVNKLNELLERDPDMKGYIAKKLGIKPDKGFVEKLKELGFDLGEIYKDAKEFLGQFKLPVGKQPPPPPTMMRTPEEVERGLPPQVVLPEIDEKATFGSVVEETVPIEEAHLPLEPGLEETPTEQPEAPATEPTKSKSKKKKKPRKGYSTRELSKEEA